MFHPSELHPGRDTWNSQPNGGPNRGQWGPVTDRTWSPSSRGERKSSHHSQDKVPPRGHRLPLHSWDHKNQPYDGHASSQRSSSHTFQNWTRTHGGNGPPSGPPGEPYAPWREDDNHPRYCGPPPPYHSTTREAVLERWAQPDGYRSTPGRIVNHRAGMWKRPDVPQHHRDQFPQHHRDQFPQHHRDQFPQHHRDQFPQHHAPPAPRDDCPAKRRRSDGPEQTSFSGSKHSSLPPHAPSPPPRYHDKWRQLTDRDGPRHRPDPRTPSPTLQQVNRFLITS
ncbi:hypothetical protein N1851_032412 [Merluccius polli]|uniref:Uncharacterized protein n=1 Tax=Merluccius polli TaxID=89951 RepID=A0AA47NNS4_MERPO|nr:hypothetical protein N1851_032412 [Merluccius polli]